ncbi:MAG: hypothetical protein D3910_10480 [Candidatus Electrothrix sp. ATG2]|nr:hypothetical protein [Candidatus Electrothrix sp. ATG2]
MDNLTCNLELELTQYQEKRLREYLMSRVRIYELAKEAGLKSKELADKLIAMGYPIKGLSSTVDDDMAADIRRKVLGKANAEVTEKPIGMKKQTAVVRKKKTTTVVRRRSKALKDEIAKKAEAQEQDNESQVNATLKDDMSATTETASQPLETETETESSVQQQAKKNGAEGAAGADRGESKPVTTEAATPGNNETTVQEKASGTKEVKRAKGLAKIVGRVELNLQDTEKPAPRRNPRPPRGGKKGGQAEVATEPRNPASPAGRGKDRKKNKRVVEIDSTQENRAKKAGKSSRKGRQRVDFTQGGGDYNMPYRGRT